MNLKKRFNIPFNNDFENYVPTVLGDFHEYINYVYFAAPVDVAPNARIFGEKVTTKELSILCSYLASKDIGSAVTINSTYTPLTAYTNEYFTLLVNFLRTMYSNGLTSVIVKNNYILNSGVIQEYIPGLRVTAAINQMIDSYEKADNLFSMLPYNDIVWDRNLNMDVDNLRSTNARFKAKYEDARTSILLNEGCLAYCPFKVDHDICISHYSFAEQRHNDYIKCIMEDSPQLGNTIENINLIFGCQKAFNANPELIHESPFIRPEDLHLYDECADHFKIAGRTQSTETIYKIVAAYVTGSFDGYIQEYLDCLSPFVKKIHNREVGCEWRSLLLK